MGEHAGQLTGPHQLQKAIGDAQDRLAAVPDRKRVGLRSRHQVDRRHLGQPGTLGEDADHVVQPERLGTRTGNYLQLLAGDGWTSLPALPLVRQPTLILAGNDDPMIPLVNARIMQSLLPHGSLHVFDDGHPGLLTAADDLVPLVSRS